MHNILQCLLGQMALRGTARSPAEQVSTWSAWGGAGEGSDAHSFNELLKVVPDHLKLYCTSPLTKKIKLKKKSKQCLMGSVLGGPEAHAALLPLRSGRSALLCWERCGAPSCWVTSSNLPSLEACSHSSCLFRVATGVGCH